MHHGSGPRWESTQPAALSLDEEKLSGSRHWFDDEELHLGCCDGLESESSWGVLETRLRDVLAESMFEEERQ